MIDPGTVIFIIQAGVKLAGKAGQIIIDSTFERELSLPLGDDAGAPFELEALKHWREHPELRAPGGAYEGVKTPAEKVLAYRRLMHLEAGTSQLVTDALKQIKGLPQFKDGFGAPPAFQRILGTIAEIGIDYFSQHPEQLSKNTSTRQVLESFVRHLDDVSFPETTPKLLIEHVLHASLRSLQDNMSLIDDDKRLGILLSGVTQSLLEDYDALTKAEDKISRSDLVKRVSSSVLRGGAAAFTSNIDVFMPDDAKAKLLVKNTLSGVITGIAGKEDVFTNESLELIYKTALTTVAENSTVFTDHKLLAVFISKTVSALTSPQAGKVFGPETVASIVHGALDAVTENIETLIDPNTPEKQILADTVTAIANGLGKRLAGDATARDLLSTRQLIDLAKFAFSEVAKHPEQLLGDGDDELKTVLAQIIGSTAKALGDNPSQLVTGAGFLTLVQAAVQTGVLNADKLLKLDTSNVKDNVLFQITQQAAEAVLENKDPRKLMSRDVFVATVTGMLPIVSANLDGLTNGKVKKPVKTVITTALDLASDALQNRVNGANLPVLIGELLIGVLQEEVDITEAVAVVDAAKLILKHVA